MHKRTTVGPLTRAERFHEVFWHPGQGAHCCSDSSSSWWCTCHLRADGVEGKMFHRMAFTVVAALWAP